MVAMLISIQYVGDTLDSELQSTIVNNGGVPSLICIIGFLITTIWMETAVSKKNPRYILEEDERDEDIAD